MRRLLALLGVPALLVLTMVTPANASAAYVAQQLPFDTTVGQCIGGEQCGGAANRITVVIAPQTGGTFVQNVFVHARDNIGDKHQASLILMPDGGSGFVGCIDVPKAGGFLTFSLNRFVSRIDIVSTRHCVASPGDETHIESIRIV